MITRSHTSTRNKERFFRRVGKALMHEKDQFRNEASPYILHFPKTPLEVIGMCQHGIMLSVQCHLMHNPTNRVCLVCL